MRALTFLLFSFMTAGNLSMIASAKEVRVFSAVSLAEPVKEVISLLAPEVTVTTAFAGSGTLARQIENGARANIFISANPDWVDHLLATEDLREDTKRDLVSNRLVLISPRPIKPLSSVSNYLTSESVTRIAMGHPTSVPAGKYANQVLNKLGLEGRLARKLTYANSVRGVLRWVETSNVDLGIVYHTDITESSNVSVVAEIPEEFHEPVTYVIAMTSDSESDEAKAVYDALTGNAAAAIFREHGFLTMPPSSNTVLTE